MDLKLTDPDCVWDLAYHPFSDHLIQISAKNQINVWTNIKPAKDQTSDLPSSKAFALSNN